MDALHCFIFVRTCLPISGLFIKNLSPRGVYRALPSNASIGPISTRIPIPTFSFFRLFGTNAFRDPLGSHGGDL
jgi:hypothetical protein